MKKKIIFILFVCSFNAFSITGSNSLLLKEIKSFEPKNEVKTEERLDDVSSPQKVAQPTHTYEVYLAHFTQGVLAFERGDYKTAKENIILSLSLEDLNPYSYYYLGRISKETKDYNTAFKSFEKALKLSPQYDLKRKIKFELAKLNLENNKLPEARKLFVNVRSDFRRTEQYQDVLWNLLRIDIKTASSSKCRWFKSLFESYPDFSMASSWTLDSKTWLVDQKSIGCSLGFSSKERHINQLIALGQYERVKSEIEVAKNKLKRFDYLELLTNYELRAGHPDNAYKELVKDYNPKSKDEKFLDLFIKVASRSLNHDDALKAFDQRIKIEKSKRVKAQLLFRKAFLEYELGSYKEAYASFKSVTDLDPNTIYQGDVTWYLGWTSYLLKENDQALTHFNKLLNLVNRNKYFRSRDHYSVERLKYWIGHTYRAMGQLQIAKNYFNEVIAGEKLSYYSFLAAAYAEEGVDEKNQKLAAQKLIKSLSVPWANPVAEFSAGSVLAPERDVTSYVLNHQNKYETNISLTFPQMARLLDVYNEKKFQPYKNRFAYLMKSGFHEDAKWELYQLEKKSSTKEQKKNLASLYYQLADSHRASRLITIGFQTDREDSEVQDPYNLWSSTYPQPHKKLVEGSAGLYRVPENLVYSIMRAESFYSMTAMSGAGARGLLQLMPFTANRVADLLGKSGGIEPSQLFEPYINIQLGVRYLMRLMESFKGEKILAIAAYNAGPHRAEWWVSRFGHLRQDEFIEHVLFLETRNYVKKVMRYNWIYDLLYTNKLSVAEIKSPMGFELTRAPSLVEKWGPLTQ